MSVLLDASSTGLRGAIAAGLWPGSVSDPYAGLRRFTSSVVIDDAWLDANNGGSRVVEGIEVVGGSLKIETTGCDAEVLSCRVGFAVPGEQSGWRFGVLDGVV